MEGFYKFVVRAGISLLLDNGRKEWDEWSSRVVLLWVARMVNEPTSDRENILCRHNEVKGEGAEWAI